MITIFLRKKLAKNLYLENPMSATFASLSKINYSRWRPTWPPNSVSVIFQLLIVLDMWFFALNMGFWARDSIGSIMNAPNSKWPPDFKMAAILTCKDGFYYKNNHQLTPAFAWSSLDIDQMFVGTIFLLVFKPMSQVETLVCCQNFFRFESTEMLYDSALYKCTIDIHHHHHIYFSAEHQIKISWI